MVSAGHDNFGKEAQLTLMATSPLLNFVEQCPQFSFGQAEKLTGFRDEDTRFGNVSEGRYPLH
jgi:hypothetical protein